MTLENLLRIGKLKAHAADKIEIDRLTLPKTAGISAKRIRVLDGYRAARNLADYRGVPVSDAVAQECVAEARTLLKDVRAWITPHRAESG